MSWLVFRGIMPREEGFYLSPNARGQYDRKLEKKNFELEVTDRLDGSFFVRVTPKVRYGHYFFGGMIALLIGMNHYRTLAAQKERKEEESWEADLAEGEPDEDPEYEAFLREDENRRLFPKSVLWDEFEKWRAGKKVVKREE